MRTAAIILTIVVCVGCAGKKESSNLPQSKPVSPDTAVAAVLSAMYQRDFRSFAANSYAEDENTIKLAYEAHVLQLEFCARLRDTYGDDSIFFNSRRPAQCSVMINDEWPPTLKVALRGPMRTEERDGLFLVVVEPIKSQFVVSKVRDEYRVFWGAGVRVDFYSDHVLVPLIAFCRQGITAMNGPKRLSLEELADLCCKAANSTSK